MPGLRQDLQVRIQQLTRAATTQDEERMSAHVLSVSRLHQRTFVFPIGVVSALSTHHAAIAVDSHFDLSETTKRESQCQCVFQLPGRDTVARTSRVGWMEARDTEGGPSGGGKPPLPGGVEWTVWTSPSAQTSLADCAGDPADHDRRWMRCARGRGGAIDCAGSDAGD
jgi:hypothetical protein